MASCEEYCVYDKSAGKISVFEGFDFLIVGIALLITFVISLLLYLIKRCKRSKNDLRGSNISINQSFEDETYSKLHNQAEPDMSRTVNLNKINPTQNESSEIKINK